MEVKKKKKLWIEDENISPLHMFVLEIPRLNTLQIDWKIFNW